MDAETGRATGAIDSIKRGEMVVVTDDDDRENEGDLILAASHATTASLAFMVRHTSGIVCVPMTSENAERLRLGPMVSNNDAPLGTAFTTSVDYRDGLTTGISAGERASTVRALADPSIGPELFARPGHVFPLVAREGGVMVRSGHTEAAVDLCRLAGLEPVGVISELVNDNGTVMRGPEVTAFAAANALALVSVGEIIAFRQRREQLVHRVSEREIMTAVGKATAIAYATPWDPMQHLALVLGEIGDGESVLVRIHRERTINDVFSSASILAPALKRFGEIGRGVFVYLREGAVGVSPHDAVSQADGGEDDHSSARRRSEEWREIGLGAQILRDLGVRSIRLMAATERRYVGLEGFGITIEQTRTSL